SPGARPSPRPGSGGLFGAVLMLATSCKDEDLAPIATFDAAQKGAYVRWTEQGSTLVNLLDVNGSAFTYSIEFVDLEQGNLVSEYRLQLIYEDNNPENGDNSAGPLEFRSWSASEFETTATGFKGLSNITITGPEAIAAAGTTADQVLAGDNFRFVGSVTTTEGTTHNFSNSSSTVNGAAFRGFFNFTMPAACPSDLTGSFAYSSADSWCGQGAVPDGTVDIVAQGGGVYTFSDFSFGAYGPCYGSTADQPALTFTEVCTEVSFTGFVDSFGDTWTFDSDIDGAVWRIAWENTYGESGETFITNPSGSWPFTLAD
ncbi:MAG: hypothetical protein AAGJ18_17470, partial [Bacteroidota bacterium]